MKATLGTPSEQEHCPVSKSKTYFDQECPTCGRSLKIRVEYMGRRVTCQHCHANFEACDPKSAAYPPSDSGLALLKRAQELLASVDAHNSALASGSDVRPNSAPGSDSGIGNPPQSAGDSGIAANSVHPGNKPRPR